MATAFLLLALCLVMTFVVAAISRCPLMRMLTLSFDSWAEHNRLDAGELS